MPSPRYIFRRAIELGPVETSRRFAAVVTRRRAAAAVRRADLDRPTYALDVARPELARTFPPMDALPEPEWLESVVELFLGHSFDLLGSGWVDVGYGRTAAGVEGNTYGPDARPSEPEDLAARQSPANRAESLRIRRLISAGYAPIDWHADFKSGYRWAEDTWYRDIAYGDQPGVDVKVPWELARCQHLPLLAWAFAVAPLGAAYVEDCRREFRDQTLDFIAANPPRFGVNWTCTMDVAIRASNWLLAYDAFCAAGAEFDGEFEAIFTRSIFEHGRHIFDNLEWSPTLRGNHYLADIVGLLFVAASLPGEDEARGWLDHAQQEVLAESESQFLPDGANFEASTAYHRLSAEMLVYAAALLLALRGERALPTSFVSRLERAAEFAVDLHRPDGHIVQFGDNDSGRFLKLGSVFSRLSLGQAVACYANLEGLAADAPDGEYLLEEHLDLRHVVAAINGLFGRDDLSKFAGQMSYEASYVRLLAGERTLTSSPGWQAANVRIGSDEDWDAAVKASSARVVSETTFEAGGEEPQLRAYPDFGYYLMRTHSLWLAVRCGPIGQCGNGGHAHNDQLAAEVFVGGAPVWVDPGTYLYTPLPKRRDAYRSVHAHYAPRVVGREPGRLDEALFRLGDEARARCVYFGPRGFIGYHDGYGPRVWRRVELFPDTTRIIDWVDGDALPLGPMDDAPSFSRGYGWVERGGAS